MAADNNLQFIRERIYDIRSAVMYSLSNGLQRIPNSLVNVVKVDDDGHLWFVCSAPGWQVDEYEASFPARLHFYRKGKLFHVEVSGKAVIVNNKYNDYSDNDADKASERPILIRMSMNNIEYTNMDERRNPTKIENMLNRGYQWLLKTVAISRSEKSVFEKFHQTTIS